MRLAARSASSSSSDRSSPNRCSQRGARSLLRVRSAQVGRNGRRQASLQPVACLSVRRGLGFRVRFLLLERVQRVLQDDLGVFLAVCVAVGGGGGGHNTGVGRIDYRVVRLAVLVQLGALEAADDLIAGAGAYRERGLNANYAVDGLADRGGTGLGADIHEARDGVDEVGNVFLGRQALAVPALAPHEESVSFFEAVDPAGRELGGRLVLVARQLLEDGLGLVGELLVGGLTAAVVHALVPHEDKLLHVGPVAKAQARAGELRVAIEAGVFGRQRVRDGGLADGLAILGMEPLNTGLV